MTQRASKGLKGDKGDGSLCHQKGPKRTVPNGSCENIFQEWGREWKIQVLENRKEFVLTLPLDQTRPSHTITLSIIDPGQIIQKITYQ